MRILMPERILDRHTGGNTTYARKIAEGLTAQNIEVGRIPAGANPALTALSETVEGLRKGDPQDVLHYVADTGPLLSTKRPSVVTVHGVASRWITVARNPRQEFTWRTRVRRAIQCTDHVITVSNSSAADIQEVFDIPAERLTTIEHGIDTPKFSRVATLSDEVRRKIPKDFVLYLGNLEPRKNLLALIEAFSRPEVISLGVKLVIAGKPAWNADEIVRSIEESESVISLGFVSDEDRTALMQEATLFAFPSLYEGFGFPVLEALAAGAVVITSDRGSLAEVAGPSLRFPGLTADGIAQGLVTGLTDTAEREMVLEQGRAWASRYSWQKSVERHIAVYKKVAGV